MRQDGIVSVSNYIKNRPFVIRLNSPFACKFEHVEKLSFVNITVDLVSLKVLKTSTKDFAFISNSNVRYEHIWS